MKWIQRTYAEVMENAALVEYIGESHRLVSLKLTRKLQRELGLNQEGT